MDVPQLTLETVRHSSVARVMALVSLVPVSGCFKTRYEPIEPPPITGDSVTFELNGVSHTLLHPELPTPGIIAGWVRTYGPRDSVSVGVHLDGAGAPTDSMLVRVALAEEHRELAVVNTAVLALGIGVAVYALVRHLSGLSWCWGGTQVEGRSIG